MHLGNKPKGTEALGPSLHMASLGVMGTPEMARLEIHDSMLPRDSQVPAEDRDSGRKVNPKTPRQQSRKPLGLRPPVQEEPWGLPTVALMAKARSPLPAVMLKVRSALRPLSASLARMWATMLETGLFSLMVMFAGKFSSTGSLSLMSSTRIPTSIWGVSGKRRK